MKIIDYFKAIGYSHASNGEELEELRMSDPYALQRAAYEYFCDDIEVEYYVVFKDETQREYTI